MGQDPSPWIPTDGTGSSGEPPATLPAPRRAAEQPPGRRRSRTGCSGTSAGAQFEPTGTPGSHGSSAEPPIPSSLDVFLQSAAASSLDVPQQSAHGRPQFCRRQGLQRCENTQPVLPICEYHYSVADQLVQNLPHAAPCSIAHHRGSHRFRHYKPYAGRSWGGMMRHPQGTASSGGRSKSVTHAAADRRATHAASRLRPLRRRVRNTARPPRVLILARKPCFLCLFRIFG